MQSGSRLRSLGVRVSELISGKKTPKRKMSEEEKYLLVFVVVCKKGFQGWQKKVDPFRAAIMDNILTHVRALENNLRDPLRS